LNPSFFIILVSVFVDMLGYGIMLPLLPFYVQAQDGGAVIAGGLMSMYASIQLVSGPILGALSDRYGRKPILLLCLFGTGTSYLLLGLANSLSLIFLAIFLDGLTGSNLTLAHAYVADTTTAENRAKGLNYSQLAFGLGIMAGPILGGTLSGYGLSIPALVASFFAFANTVFGFFFLPESLPPERRETKADLASLFMGWPIHQHLPSEEHPKLSGCAFPAQPRLCWLADKFSALLECPLRLDSCAEQLFLFVCRFVRGDRAGSFVCQITAVFW
jgi:MFS family permease